MAGDEFAGMLRELKERSGLSYGALAKRLHVSTSTLHRYVNGDAVPADYAPVERLARVCRATPDELVELHRRWVLADVLRGKKAPGRPGNGSYAGAVDAPPVVPGIEAADASGAAPGAGTRGTAAGTADGGPEGVGEEAGGAAPVRPSRLRNRRAAVLAGVGAVVVTAVVSGVLAVQLGSGGGDDDAGAGAGAVEVPSSARPSAAGTTPGARHGSASPSASRHPSPEPSGSPVGGAVDENGVVDDNASDEGAGAPTVVVDPYKFDDPCSQHYLVNRPAQQVPPPPNESDARGWVTALGGVPGGEQLLALTVQGAGKATVVLKALHVRVLDKGAPLAWNDYAMGVGCGGGVETKSFIVDLDAGRPSVALKGGQRDFPYKVSESDPEVFYVFADAQAHNVSWYLELDWSSGTRSGTVRVDDHGKPFRTSGNVGRPAYDHPLGGSEWGKAAPPG
ncbi:helix-turn-helix domain-containing protein [Streptomyces sp. NPDC006173]|uniref:helix-turn-helix domain-containing protein n=1 Tax=Streptomyces sp. NPDC006173 TaxID=3155349 RepID=UPI0033CDBF2E